MPSPTFFVTQAQRSRLGAGAAGRRRGVSDDRRPNYSLREVPEEIPPLPWAGRRGGSRRERRAGRPAPRRAAAATLPLRPPLSLSVPGGRGSRRRLPLPAPRRKGLTERGRGSSGGEGVPAGRKREGRRGGVPEAAREPPHTPGGRTGRGDREGGVP